MTFTTMKKMKCILNNQTLWIFQGNRIGSESLVSCAEEYNIRTENVN